VVDLEMLRMRKKVVVVLLQIIGPITTLPGGAEETHRKNPPGYLEY